MDSDLEFIGLRMDSDLEFRAVSQGLRNQLVWRFA